MRAANLAVKFLLELCALGLLVAWGARTGSGWVSVVLAIAAPVVMILVWGRWAAPRAPRRLPLRRRIPLESVVFGVAAVLGYVAGLQVLALVFTALAVVNAAGLTAFHQWEG